MCFNLNEIINHVNQIEDLSNSFSNVQHLNDENFEQILLHDNDIVTFVKQKHFVFHNVTCFKYKSNQVKCRFEMFKNIVFESITNQHEIIHIKKNNS